MPEDIVNRVAASGLETFDLAEYFPRHPIMELDLRDWLYQGLIIREKDFREKAAEFNWETFRNTIVCIHCSTDAIIPLWAFMLITSMAAPVAEWVFAGTQEEMLKAWYARELQSVDAAAFAGKRIVVKGCGDHPVPNEAYVEITNRLLPYVKSIMFGEPCSTVPVFKKKS